MKKITLTLLTAILISCTDNQNTQLITPENPNYLFQATYSQDFTMGNPELVVKFQNLLKNCQEKKLDNLSSYFTDDVVWSLPDGNRIEGKDSVVYYLTDFWSSSATVIDYSSAVHFCVKTKEGEEWVLIWDSQTINDVGIRYQEAIAFEGSKIRFMNTFTKPRK